MYVTLPCSCSIVSKYIKPTPSTQLGCSELTQFSVAPERSTLNFPLNSSRWSALCRPCYRFDVCGLPENALRCNTNCNSIKPFIEPQLEPNIRKTMTHTSTITHRPKTTMTTPTTTPTTRCWSSEIAMARRHQIGLRAWDPVSLYSHLAHSLWRIRQHSMLAHSDDSRAKSTPSNS